MDIGTGYASVGADTASAIFLGVAVEKADNSDGDDGDIRIRVYKTGVYQYTKGTAVAGDLTVQAYIRDDNTVALSTTNSVKCGFIVDIIDSSTVKVRIDHDAQ